MSDVARKYLDNQSDMEEGEIIDDNTYENISSDEELTLRQRITELEERNMELERIADLSHTFDYGLDYGPGTMAATCLPGTTAHILNSSGTVLDNQKLIGRYENKYKNIYNKKVSYPSDSKKRLTITRVNNYYRNKVRRKTSVTSNKKNNYKAYLRNISSSESEDDSMTKEHKQKLIVALNHKTGTTPVITKTSLKKKLFNMNKNNKRNREKIKNESDKDSDLELRLIALKSALVKKYGTKRPTVNKSHVIEERPYSPTDLLDKLTEQSIINNDSDYMDISPVESPRGNTSNENNNAQDIDNNDCILQSVDMDLANSDSNNSVQFNNNNINNDWLSLSKMPLANHFFMEQQNIYNYQKQYYNNNNSIKAHNEEDDDEEALRVLLLSKKETPTTPMNHFSPSNIDEDNDKYDDDVPLIDNYHEKIVNKNLIIAVDKPLAVATNTVDATLETDCLRNLLLSMMKKKTINETNISPTSSKNNVDLCDVAEINMDNDSFVENNSQSLIKDESYISQSKDNSNFAIENNITEITKIDNLPLNSFENILSNVNDSIKKTNNIIKETNYSAISNEMPSQATINAKVLYSKRKIVNQSKLNNKVIKLNSNTKALPINVNDIQIPIVNPIIFNINDNSSDTDDDNSDSDNSNIRNDFNKSPISIQMDSSLYSPSSPLQSVIITPTQPLTISLQNSINGNKENYNKTMLIHNKPEFEEKLDEFLQNARNKVEQKLLNTNNKNIVTNIIDNQSQHPVTPLAVRHLPQSSQLEYRRLVNRMSMLEKQKQYKLKKYLFGKELNKTIKDNNKKISNVKKLKNAITTATITKDTINELLSTNVPVNSMILNEEKILCDNNNSCCNNNNNNNSNNINNNTDRLTNDKVDTNTLNDCDNLIINQSDCVKDSATLLNDIDKLIKLINKVNMDNNKVILLEKSIEKLYNELKIMKNDLNVHKNAINTIYPKILLKNENLTTNMENIIKNYNLNKNHNNSGYRLPKSMKIEIVNKIKLLLKENSKLDSESLKTIKNGDYNESNYKALLKLYENVEEIDDTIVDEEQEVIIKKENLLLKHEITEEIKNVKDGNKDEITLCNNKVARSYQSPLDSLNNIKVIRNPDGVICPFQLMGQCEDKECKYEHL